MISQEKEKARDKVYGIAKLGEIWKYVYFTILIQSKIRHASYLIITLMCSTNTDKIYINVNLSF